MTVTGPSLIVKSHMSIGKLGLDFVKVNCFRMTVQKAEIAEIITVPECNAAGAALGSEVISVFIFVSHRNIRPRWGKRHGDFAELLVVVS